ncbi:unnamed protein product [Linum trigynum]|uniref:RNase H type-1 domain-containing protein n=1 Tax=Linum trigynum TaxID=586398 RepID=A0AAV2E0A6_9ROSI
MEHLFLDCPFARVLWESSGMDYIGQGLSRHTFPLFLKKLMSLLHQPLLFMKVVAILWKIWRSRNWIVFEGKQFGIPALMRQFNQQYEEWVSLPVDPILQPVPPLAINQSTSNSSTTICRWDGATRSGSHSAGGIVIMDANGGLVLAKGLQFPLIDEPLVVELLVLREDILWCQSLGFKEMRFEGDAKVIIEKINRAYTRNNQMGQFCKK